MTATVITDHVAAAVARLDDQFKFKTTIVKLLSALIRPVQSLENVAVDVLLQRTVTNAEGAQLDLLGKLVGQAREGAGDVEYRRFVRAKIAANKSRGTAEDVYLVAELVINDPSVGLVIEESDTMSAVIRGTDSALPNSDVLIPLLGLAKPLTTRLNLEYLVTDAANTFTTAESFGTLSSAVILGATTLPMYDSSSFPASGTVTINTGLATSEDVTYTGNTGTGLTGVSALAGPHDIDSAIQINDPNKAFGSIANPTPAGQFAGAVKV